jgi:hypothetical protein
MAPRVPIRVVHLVGGVAAALILLVGVLGIVRLVRPTSSVGPDETVTTATTMDSSPSSSRTTGTNDPTSTGTGPTTSRDGGRRRRSVVVGGVTVDNLFPQNDGKLSPGAVRCLDLVNRGYVVPVRIEAIDIVTDEGPRPLALGTGSCTHPPCLGAEMRPFDNRCDVVVKVPDVVGRYRGRLLLRLSTRCTEAKNEPCNLVPNPPPSPGNPVNVSWSVTEKVQTEVRGPDEDGSTSSTSSSSSTSSTSAGG